MEPKTSKSPESVVREIKRKTRRKFNSEEKIRIILEGLKGEILPIKYAFTLLNYLVICSVMKRFQLTYHYLNVFVFGINGETNPYFLYIGNLPPS